jgi:hypothetical protein
MKKILIFGAGSIGNHLANACRKNKLDVSIVDISFEALSRMKNKIYPSRYKKWDDNIKILNYTDVFKSKVKYYLIIIGTPPSTHLSIVKKIKKSLSYKKLLIEKPLTTFKQKKTIPSLFKNKEKIFVGYNHSISNSFIYFADMLKKNISCKDIQYIEINWKEGWNGILNAHFWLKDEFSSYLGDVNKGGGSLHEHSHGLHLAVCLGDILKFKLPNNFSSNLYLKYNKCKKKYYDSFSNINWSVKNFFINYTTDLITEPAEKSIKIFTKKLIYVIIFNYNKKVDKIEILNKKNEFLKKKIFFKKKRSTDFINEIRHIINCNSLKLYNKSFIKLENGLRVQAIINKALKNAVKI